MVGDGLVESVLPVPTAGDSTGHEEVDVVGELFAVDGVGREEDGCPAALCIVRCFLRVFCHCRVLLSVNDRCLDDVGEGDFLDGDRLVVHVRVVVERFCRCVVVHVVLAGRVAVCLVCGGRGWGRHE